MFRILDLIRSKFQLLVTNNGTNYFAIPTNPATGLLFATDKNLGFLSGRIRMRAKNGGQYPYHYVEMIDTIFGREDNTIEVWSGNVNDKCFKVDINLNFHFILSGSCKS